MNREQKKLKKDIQHYREVCKEHYHISKEHKCEGCPYEHDSGCILMLIFRKMNTQVPCYWTGTVIEDIFKES